MGVKNKCQYTNENRDRAASNGDKNVAAELEETCSGGKHRHCLDCYVEGTSWRQKIKAWHYAENYGKHTKNVTD